MITITLETAAAIALHAAEQSWIMFLQVMSVGSQGPIKIEGVNGRRVLGRLEAIAEDNPYEVRLVGLMPSMVPYEDAKFVADELAAYQIRSWWFEPSLPVLTYINDNAQDALADLISKTKPGALDSPVDIEAIAQILDCSVPTVRRMIKAKKIPFHTDARGTYYFIPQDVLASLSTLDS